jgi:hypothetical protein
LTVIEPLLATNPPITVPAELAGNDVFSLLVAIENPSNIFTGLTLIASEN